MYENGCLLIIHNKIVIVLRIYWPLSIMGNEWATQESRRSPESATADPFEIQLIRSLLWENDTDYRLRDLNHATAGTRDSATYFPPSGHTVARTATATPTGPIRFITLWFETSFIVFWVLTFNFQVFNTKRSREQN